MLNDDDRSRKILGHLKDRSPQRLDATCRRPDYDD
jgi:hypothetical protein